MAGFCTNCGSPLAEGAAFCGRCGTPVGSPSVPAPPPAPAAAPQPPPVPASGPAMPGAKKSGNLFLKIVAGILAFFALSTVIAIGSCLYIGSRVKRKAETFTTELKKPMEGTPGVSSPSGQMRHVEPCPAVDPAQSEAFRSAAASASIPLKPGLTLISTYSNQSLNGRDVEILKTVQSVEENSVTVQAARTEPGTKPSTRILCIADLVSARQSETYFHPQMPQIIGGTTMFSVSQAVFQDWKAGRTAEFGYVEVNLKNSGPDQFSLLEDSEGTLSRAEPNDVAFSVIVNGERKDLASIHLKGRLGPKDTEAYVLDDPADPITLHWAMSSFHITYLKINFPVEKKIEQDLAQGRCAALYNIYFDFDSARLLPQSGPGLKEISDALKHNPGWKVKIEGHTDNIGGDAYNMPLSTRRAEAVRQALVTDYQVSSDRLSSQGFGARRPKDSNDTAEGRALNRRVELCRR